MDIFLDRLVYVVGVVSLISLSLLFFIALISILLLTATFMVMLWPDFLIYMLVIGVLGSGLPWLFLVLYRKVIG